MNQKQSNVPEFGRSDAPNDVDSTVPYDFVVEHPDPGFVLDERDRILWANPVAVDVFCEYDCSAGNEVPKPLLEILERNEDRDSISIQCVEITDRQYRVRTGDGAGCKKRFLYLTEVHDQRTEFNQWDVFNVCPDVVYRVDCEGYFTHLTPSVRRLGYEPDELIGTHFEDLLSPDQSKSVSRRTLLPLLEGLSSGSEHAPKLFDERRTGDRRTEGLIVKLQTADDQSRSVEVTSRGVHGSETGEFLGTVGVIRDVTERLEEMRAIEQRERQFRELAENVNEVFWMFNGTFSEFIYANDKAEDIYGVDREELKRDPLIFMEDVHPDYRGKVRDSMEQLMTGTKTKLEYPVNSDENYRRWVSVEGVPVVERGQVVTIIGSAREITERKKYEKELLETRDRLRTKSYQDALTEIPNRRFFDNRLQEEWSRARRNEDDLGLLMTDIDFFKQFNDAYGHQAGDECLKMIARAFDDKLERETDVVARYGGEEFAVILPGTDIEGVEEVAYHLLNAVSDLKIPHEDSDIEAVVTISLGGSSAIPVEGMTESDLLSASDRALYRSKTSGRNCVATIELT